MKISYYPGCTLKYKAKNLETAALASLDALGIQVEEMDRWNCCGAVFSLANDDLIHMVGPVRNLLRAKEQGADSYRNALLHVLQHSGSCQPAHEKRSGKARYHKPFYG